MGSAGTGGVTHLAGELFKIMAGVNLVHVPFRSNGPALTAMLGGQVEVEFSSMAASLEYIRTGKLRGLATSGAVSSSALPNLPTIGEFVPGYEITAWFGVGAPKGTPAEVIDKINSQLTAGLANPKMKERLAEFGEVPMPMTPTEFGKLIADETEKWAKVIKSAGIKLD